LKTKTQLVQVRVPNRNEIKGGAEVVFIRLDREPGIVLKGHRGTHTIYAAKCFESFEQWGAPYSVLADNLTAAYNWRRHNVFR
jgi:hypothetical protein